VEVSIFYNYGEDVDKQYFIIKTQILCLEEQIRIPHLWFPYPDIHRDALKKLHIKVFKKLISSKWQSELSAATPKYIATDITGQAAT